MNKIRMLSPDVVLKESCRLVPLKQKFSTSALGEVPGWRTAASESPKDMKVEPSKLFKVKSKKDFHLPLNFAIDKRLPIILKPKNFKKPQKKSLRFGKTGKITGKESQQVNLTILSRPSKVKNNTNEHESPHQLFRFDYMNADENANAGMDLRKSSQINSESILNENISTFKSVTPTVLSQFSLLDNSDKQISSSESKETDSHCTNNELSIPSDHLSRLSLKTNPLNRYSNFSPPGTLSPHKNLLSQKQFLSSLSPPHPDPNFLDPDISPLHSCVSLQYPDTKPQPPSEENLSSRRKSEVVHLLRQSAPLKTSHKSLKLLSSFKTIESRGSESESVSLEEDDELAESPQKQISKIRKNIEKSGNANRDSKMVLADDGKSEQQKRKGKDLINGSRSERNSTQQYLLGKATPELDNLTRKSVTKNFYSKDLKLPESVKRSSTSTQNLVKASSQEHLQSLKQYSNLTPIKSGRETISTVASPSQNVPGIYDKDLKSTTSLKIKLRASEALPRPSFISIHEGSNSTRPSINKPSKKLAIQKSLKNPPKKTQTSNLDTNGQPVSRKKKKLDSEKYQKNPIEKNKTSLVDRDSSSEHEAKVLIKITQASEAPDKSQYDRKAENSTPHKDLFIERYDQRYLTTPNLNLIQVPIDKTSGLPTKSRTNSHEWTIPVLKPAENTKKTLSTKKESNKISLDNSKKSPKPQKKKESSDPASDEASSNHSEDSFHSSVSKLSNSQRVRLDRKYLTTQSIKAFRKGSQRNPTSLKFLKNFIFTEVNKKLGRLDPVTNFLYNFSFCILSSLKSLVRTSSILRNSKMVNLRKTRKIIESELFDKDALAGGKLRINKLQKKESRLFASATPNFTRKIKTFKNPAIPSFYPREITLKAMNSLRRKKAIPPPQRLSDIASPATEVHSNETSKSESSESEISSSEEIVSRNYLKKSLMYELAQQDLILQMAKQILEVNEGVELLAGISSSTEHEEVQVEDSGEDLEEEIKGLGEKLHSFNGKFAFGNEIDLKTLQKRQMVFSFNEIGDGCFEIDMENLIRESAKRHFLEKKKIQDEGMGKGESELWLLPYGNMDEEQMYRARIQKVKVFGKKLKKRRDKLKMLSVERGDIQKINQKRKGFANPGSVFGDNFEERVYFRLKGSASPVFFKKSC